LSPPQATSPNSRRRDDRPASAFKESHARIDPRSADRLQRPISLWHFFFCKLILCLSIFSPPNPPLCVFSISPLLFRDPHSPPLTTVFSFKLFAPFSLLFFSGSSWSLIADGFWSRPLASAGLAPKISSSPDRPPFLLPLPPVCDVQFFSFSHHILFERVSQLLSPSGLCLHCPPTFYGW